MLAERFDSPYSIHLYMRKLSVIQLGVITREVYPYNKNLVRLKSLHENMAIGELHTLSWSGMVTHSCHMLLLLWLYCQKGNNAICQTAKCSCLSLGKKPGEKGRVNIWSEEGYISGICTCVAYSILLNPIIVATGSRRKLEGIAQCCLWDVVSSLIIKLSHDVSLVLAWLKYIPSS